MRGSSEKKKNLIIIAIEAVVLIIAAVCSLIMYRSQQGMVVDPTTSYSSYAVLDDGVWSVDTGAVEAG